MNKKSILGIFLVLIALSLTIGSVSAEDIAIDDVSSGDVMSVEGAPASDDVAAADDVQAAGGDDLSAEVTSDLDVADVGVEVTALEETPDYIIWGIIAYNLGPDTATNTIVELDGSDNLVITDYLAFDGVFDDEIAVWYIGDLLADDYTELLIQTYKLGPAPYFVDALIYSDAFDPYIWNNYDIAFVGLDASAAEETLPATGNPIAMALLALIALGVGGLRRRL